MNVSIKILNLTFSKDFLATIIMDVPSLMYDLDNLITSLILRFARFLSTALPIFLLATTATFFDKSLFFLKKTTK